MSELLDPESDLKLSDASYSGPLQAAVLRGHLEIVQLLSNGGADVVA